MLSYRNIRTAARALILCLGGMSAQAFSDGGERLGLSDFDQIGDAQWEESRGTIAASSGSGFLVTPDAYHDFSITLEFKPSENTNSGVFMRCSDKATINDRTCYEANIFDHRPDQSGRTGSIVHVAAPAVVIDTEGRWNTYQLTLHKSHLIVKLNGQVTVDTYDDGLAAGNIALQYASGSIQFRNIQIESLAASPFEQSIIGVWQLTGFELDEGNGNVQPWCEGAYGMIMYYQDHMSVAINCKSNPQKMVHYSGRSI